MQRMLSAFAVNGSLHPRRQQMMQAVMSIWTYLSRSDERVRRKVAQRARAKIRARTDLLSRIHDWFVQSCKAYWEILI